jgi:hypothetical protein
MPLAGRRDQVKVVAWIQQREHEGFGYRWRGFHWVACL